MLKTKVSFQSAKRIVKTVLFAKRTVFLFGPPGVGKSALGREIAQELGAELCLLDAPLVQPIDYLAAVPNHEMKKVMLYPTGFIPEKGPAVVLVDDLPHAKPYQQTPLLQMALDRRIGPIKFSDDVYFILTGNREEDLAEVNPIISPLLNRLVQLELEPSLEEWLEWGGETIREEVQAFLKAYPTEFVRVPQEGQNAWPTPRSWHILSDCLNYAERLSSEEVRALAYGTVGEYTGGLFFTFVAHLRGIDPTRIVEKGEIPQETARERVYAYMYAVCSLLKGKGVEYLNKWAKNIVKFFDQLPGEFKTAMLKELCSDRGKKTSMDLVEELRKYSPQVDKHLLSLLRG